jgi:TolA-binding protein
MVGDAAAVRFPLAFSANLSRMHALFEGTVSETSKQDVEFLKQFEPDVFWQQHGKKILTGVVVVVLIGLAVYYWQKQAAAQEEAAAAELSMTTDPATLQRLAKDYQGKAVGAQALLRIAELENQARHFKEAAAAFQSFFSQYPNHPLAETAQLGSAAAQEAQGNFQEAKTQYQQILLGHPSSYTAIAAKLGMARCDEALGLTKEALQIYEELRPAVRGLPWETEVYVRSMVLSRSQPAEAMAPTNTPMIPLVGGPAPKP